MPSPHAGTAAILATAARESELDSRTDDRSPAVDAARALPLFSEHVLQYRLVQAQFGHQLLHARILHLQLLHLPHLIDFQPNVLFLPAAERPLADHHSADQLRDRYSDRGADP